MMAIARFLVYGGLALFLISLLIFGIGCVGAFEGALQGETGTSNTVESVINFSMITMVLSLFAVFVGIILALIGRAFGAKG